MKKGKLFPLWFSVIADLLAIIGFLLSVFLLINFYPAKTELSFDYQAVLCAIIGAIFTLLVGWNIYQMVDWKHREHFMSEIHDKMNGEITYFHNKSSYSQAIMYAMMSQLSSVSFAPNEKTVLKHEMLSKGILALKILSNFPDCQKEIDAVIKTLIKGLDNSCDVPLSEDSRIDLIMSCGEINNRESIECFSEFIEMLRHS